MPLDLDDPEYFAEQDLAAYALACLQLAGDERPGNPYADGTSAVPLADRIAAISGRNFLIAGLIARSHGLHDAGTRRPGAASATEATVRTALAGLLIGFPKSPACPPPACLRLSAFAEAPGLPARPVAAGGPKPSTRIHVSARGPGPVRPDPRPPTFLVETDGIAMPGLPDHGGHAGIPAVPPGAQRRPAARLAPTSVRAPA